ncbi:hypothetical protein RBE51_21445 [Pseudomonas taiwanensis]|uniref:hypothetical protein n=1 Tax=Pseudomonas taiwanensis TaxID=470150 RepID=UPI0028DE717C|nr:hypothetical protein [Pseudomonas taiwanensis]MDT8925364.1 hypothetical protein [Pseudomonas taiwanensis]
MSQLPTCFKKTFDAEFGCDISQSQGQELWGLIKDDLHQTGHQALVQTIEQSAFRLLTRNTGIFMSALSRVTIGTVCPPIFDPGYTTCQKQIRDFLSVPTRGMANTSPTPASSQTLVEVEDAKGNCIRVLKQPSGVYDIATKLQGTADSTYVLRHPECSADDAIRALGHYLQF